MGSVSWKFVECSVGFLNVEEKCGGVCDHVWEVRV